LRTAVIGAIINMEKREIAFYVRLHQSLRHRQLVYVSLAFYLHD
jgi:hypothetical protein